MLEFIKKIFLKNIGLKLISLILALAIWFYIVNELHRGSEEERRLLQQILPSEGTVAKKLMIQPIFVGKPRSGYAVAKDKVVVVPEYCIVVGTRELLGKIRFAYTMPIEVNGVYKSFTRSISLSPIAPGVYMEDTLIQVAVPVEKREE